MVVRAFPRKLVTSAFFDKIPNSMMRSSWELILLVVSSFTLVMGIELSFTNNKLKSSFSAKAFLPANQMPQAPPTTVVTPTTPMPRYMPFNDAPPRSPPNNFGEAKEIQGTGIVFSNPAGASLPNLPNSFQSQDPRYNPGDLNTNQSPFRYGGQSGGSPSIPYPQEQAQLLTGPQNLIRQEPRLSLTLLSQQQKERKDQSPGPMTSQNNPRYSQQSYETLRAIAQNELNSLQGDSPGQRRVGTRNSATGGFQKTFPGMDSPTAHVRMNSMQQYAQNNAYDRNNYVSQPQTSRAEVMAPELRQFQAPYEYKRQPIRERNQPLGDQNPLPRIPPGGVPTPPPNGYQDNRGTPPAPPGPVKTISQLQSVGPPFPGTNTKMNQRPNRPFLDKDLLTPNNNYAENGNYLSAERYFKDPSSPSRRNVYKTEIVTQPTPSYNGNGAPSPVGQNGFLHKNRNSENYVQQPTQRRPYDNNAPFVEQGAAMATSQRVVYGNVGQGPLTERDRPTYACRHTAECESGCCYTDEGEVLDTDTYGPQGPKYGQVSGFCTIREPGLQERCDDLCTCQKGLECYRRYETEYSHGEMMAQNPNYQPPEPAYRPARKCVRKSVAMAERHAFWRCYFDSTCSGPLPS